jgi:hypothetical protein
MKIVSALLLIGASLTASGQSEFSKQTVGANPPFKLEITANIDKEHSEKWDFLNSAETVRNTDSIAELGFAIRKTNITDHEINKWSEAGGGAEIRDDDGNLIKPREFGSKPGDGLGGGEAMLKGTKDMVLQPGESKVKHELIGDWYDMSRPGMYTIQVWEHVSNDPASEIVKSNIITITVLPAESKPPADESSSQTKHQPFTITIKAETPQVKVGGQVILDVIMTNTSDHEIDCSSYWYDSIDQNYRYHVLYEDGKPAAKIVRKTGSSAHSCILDPGESRQSGGLVSQIFNFRRPGKYTIQVSRPVWGDDQRPETWQTHENDPEIEIKSNTITITVVPEPEANASQ